MKPQPQEKLNELRKEIDAIDQQFLKLLSERGKRVVEIGETKRDLGMPFYVPEREGKVLDSLKQANQGPYPHQAIETIFREIMSASLALESPLKIAYLGPQATFTNLAAIRRFGLSAQFLPQTSIAQVFQEVSLKHVDYGVVPIENSTEGVVNHTLDLFVEHSVKICGEVTLPISHHLLSKEKNLKKIKKVYSHPHALAQCRNWLDSYLPEVKTLEVSSTGKAAELVSQEPDCAAIASEYAATLYHLEILQKNIEDQLNNYTRFVVIGYQDCKPTGHDKTSFICSAKDEVGTLYQLLTPLAQSKINLTKIESRPLKGRAWEYFFFMDLDGHQQDEPIKKALQDMQKQASFLKILGSYPKSI